MSALRDPMTANQALDLVETRLADWARDLSAGEDPDSGGHVAANTLETFAMTALPAIRRLAAAWDGMPPIEMPDADEASDEIWRACDCGEAGIFILAAPTETMAGGLTVEREISFCSLCGIVGVHVPGLLP